MEQLKYLDALLVSNIDELGLLWANAKNYVMNKYLGAVALDFSTN